MATEIVESTPPEQGDRELIQEFHKEQVKQVERLDNIAKELFKLELGIPGIYAVVLTMIAEKNMVISYQLVLWVFLFWLLAVVLTFVGLFPKKYNVLRDTPRRVKTTEPTDEMTIEEFYQTSATRKYTWLALAAFFFFTGILLAIAFIIVGFR